MDEIHLLNEDRGPILEQIILRFLSTSFSKQVQHKALVTQAISIPNIAIKKYYKTFFSHRLLLAKLHLVLFRAYLGWHRNPWVKNVKLSYYYFILIS